MPDYLDYRPEGMTHHMAVLNQSGFAKEISFGFSLIKINNDFAQLKTASASLNENKPQRVYNRSFTRATMAKTSKFTPTVAQMPVQWRDSLVRYFKESEFTIRNVAVSLD